MDIEVRYDADIRTVWRRLHVDGELVGSFATDRELVDYLAHGADLPEPKGEAWDEDDWLDFADAASAGDFGYTIDIPKLTDFVS